MKNNIKVEWLNPCTKCNSGEVTVDTKFEKEDMLLQEGDVATCSCGNTGEIVVYDEIAECIWDPEFLVI